MVLLQLPHVRPPQLHQALPFRRRDLRPAAVLGEVTLQLRHGRGKGDLGPPVTTGDFTTQHMGGYSGDVMGYTHIIYIYMCVCKTVKNQEVIIFLKSLFYSNVTGNICMGNVEMYDMI